jgi:endonuclease III-like uncharacterized protein
MSSNDNNKRRITRTKRVSSILNNNNKKSKSSSSLVVVDHNNMESKITSTFDPKTPTPTPRDSSSSHLLLLLLKKLIHNENASFNNFSPEQAAKIRLALLEWYQTHRWKLPWQGDPPPFDGSTAAATTAAATTTTTNKIKIKANDYNHNATQIPFTAYGVWVSEVMLQQTRVEAVIPYYLRWIQSFSTVQHLANATPEQVNSNWAGLGFYRRARLLHEAAQHLVQHHHGQLPQTVTQLETIPGIGKYTASAIATLLLISVFPLWMGMFVGSYHD